jgi:hypothetical protein
MNFFLNESLPANAAPPSFHPEVMVVPDREGTRDGEQLLEAGEGAELRVRVAVVEVGVVAEEEEGLRRVLDDVRPERLRARQVVARAERHALDGRADVDRAAVDRAAVDRAAVDRAAVDRADVDRAAVGRAAVDRADVDGRRNLLRRVWRRRDFLARVDRRARRPGRVICGGRCGGLPARLDATVAAGALRGATREKERREGAMTQRAHVSPIDGAGCAEEPFNAPAIRCVRPSFTPTIAACRERWRSSSGSSRW